MPTTHLRRRAFTIIELLVVIAIIGILISILIPVVGTARDQAKLAATRSMMTNIGTAAVSFENDERRQPGFFPINMLGDSGNDNLGLTAMENAILELSGGIFSAATPDSFAFSAAFLDDGETYYIDPTVIGATSKSTLRPVRAGGYFTPDPDSFQVLTGQASNNTDFRTRMPDVVDAFGQPILAWVAEDQPTISQSDDQWFAAIDTNSAPTDGRPHFYWTTNAGFLNATNLGDLGVNPDRDSLLGGSRGDDVRRRTLAAVLGNPAFPDVSFTNFARPSAARGTFILHSAGRNGLWIGDSENAAKTSPGNAAGQLEYLGTEDAMEQSDDEIAGFGA